MQIHRFPLDRQLDMMDCGPASLKMVAKHYGKYYSLPYLRDLCGNTREGVSLAGISHGAKSIGLRSLAAHCSTKDIIEKVPLPVIIHWDNSHFVVLYDVRERKNGGAKFHIADPARGYVTYNREEFEDKWIKKNENKTSGIALILEPQADFKQRQAGEKAERGRHLENIMGYFTPYKKSFAYLGMVMFLNQVL
jgi:ATP-binding cassette subfamily B protein